MQCGGKRATAVMAGILALAAGLANCSKGASQADVPQEVSGANPSNSRPDPGAARGLQALPVGSGPAPRLLARREIALASKPTGLLARDLDGDGRAELLAAVQEPGQLLLWRNSALGLAAEPRRLACGAWPLGPVLLEASAARLCLAVASRATLELEIFDAQAASSLARASLPDKPLAIAAGSLSGKGVIAIASNTHLRLYDAQASLLGEVELQGQRPAAVLLARDGAGLVVALQEPRALLWVPVDAQGRIDTLVRYGRLLSEFGAPLPRALCEADLDGDGDGELCVAAGDQSVLVFGLGAKQGSLRWLPPDSKALVERAPGLVPLDLEAADLDRDGRSELLCLGFNDSNYGVLGGWSAAGASISFSEYAGQSPWDLSLGDLDGDGRLDLVVANRDAQAVGQMLGTGLVKAGKDAFYQALRLRLGANDSDYDPCAIAAVDLTGDGLQEALVLNARGTLTRFLNRDLRLVDPQTVVVGSGARALACADLDRDGHADALALCDSERASELVLLRGDGAGRLERGASTQLGQGQRGTRLALLDLEQDGSPEALVLDREGRALHVFRFDAAQRSFLPLAEHSLGFEPRALAAIEFSGDARAELALAGQGAEGPELVVIDPREARAKPLARLLLGTQGVQGRMLPIDLAVADIDGDRRGDLCVLLGDGMATSQGQVLPVLVRASALEALPVLATGLLPSRLLLRDLNADGSADLAVAVQNSHTVQLWLTRLGPQGALDFEQQANVGAGLGPLDLCSANLNGDPLPELLVANSFSHDLSAIYNLPAR